MKMYISSAVNCFGYLAFYALNDIFEVLKIWWKCIGTNLLTNLCLNFLSCHKRSYRPTTVSYWNPFYSVKRINTHIKSLSSQSPMKNELLTKYQRVKNKRGRIFSGFLYFSPSILSATFSITFSHPKWATSCMSFSAISPSRWWQISSILSRQTKTNHPKLLRVQHGI